jgi:hypothetical protein
MMAKKMSPPNGELALILQRLIAGWHRAGRPLQQAGGLFLEFGPD